MYDFVVIGGGIAGLASAELLQRSGRNVLLLESESLLGTKSSSEMHGWFHTGALYAALPDKSFFKTLVGNLDDLLSYYSCFDDMNLELDGYLKVKAKSGWFSNNLNLYSYVDPMDKSIPLAMKPLWYLAIKNARRQLEGFDKLVSTQDLSTQTLSFKSPRTRSTVHDDPLPYNLGKISETFITHDRTMNACAIMRSLTASFLMNGGEIRTGVEVLQLKNHRVVTTVGEYHTKLIIDARGSRNPMASSVYLSPLAVVYPSLSDLNFIKMTPIVKNTFNHLTHRSRDFQYSVVGNGIYIKGTEEEKERIRLEIEDKIVNTFGIDRSKHKIEIYYGTKTEITKRSQLRNYQYHIVRDKNIISILPGKFTLSFSLAVNLCRRLGISPVSTLGAAPSEEHVKMAESLVSTSKHFKIAKNLATL